MIVELPHTPTPLLPRVPNFQIDYFTLYETSDSVLFEYPLHQGRVT